MHPSDLDDVLTLWKEIEGIGLSPSDTVERISRYLECNPGLSFVAYDGPVLVAAMLCGHDGRRGYIHHLAVLDGHRRHGIGQELVRRCLARLRSEGIEKCHLFVLGHNDVALRFWERSGWRRRTDLEMFSKETGPEATDSGL
jgi:putative acetyltransferase